MNNYLTAFLTLRNQGGNTVMKINVGKKINNTYLNGPANTCHDELAPKIQGQNQ